MTNSILPDTRCEDCFWAECTPIQKLAVKVSEMVLVIPNPNYSSAIKAALGTPEPSWYERHRALYEETGDVKELVRMERHIENNRNTVS